MRILGIFVLALLAGTLSAAEPAIEIEFEYAPSWHGETLVYLVRLPDGKIHCEVLTRPEVGSVATERKWKKIKEFSVASDIFARLAHEFETPELKRSAEREWPAVPDGSRWRLKRKRGSFAIEIIAHNPDVNVDGAPIVQLARAISAAASAGLFPK